MITRYQRNVVKGSIIGLLALICTACMIIEEREPVYRIQMEHHLHAGMKNMAGHLVDLSALSFDKDLSEEEKTSSVLAALDKIEATASTIGGPGVVTNYAVVNRYMGAFLYDVRLAKEFSRRTPPNHFPAYSLVKSCLSCHDSI